MTQDSFSASQTIPAEPDTVFRTICDVRSWWEGDIDGASDKLGDEFVYARGEVHRTTQRVVEFEPAKRLVWLVTQSHLSWVDDPQEWLDTRIIFALAPVNGGTKLTFTHEGLVPERECYEGCSGGWSHFILSSLRQCLLAKVTAN